MGLAESRKKQEITEKTLPYMVKTVSEKTKGATAGVTIDIDWAPIENDIASLQAISISSLQDSLYAVEDTCKDEMGKSAVKQKLKKVVFVPVTDAAQINSEFKDGTLSIKVQMAPRWKAPARASIQKTLESGL